jgi:lysophospholipase L1-like esterase
MKFAAVGDSFTEGLGDERPDGTDRGWADLVAEGLATGLAEPVDYLNLAIRGRLLAPIVVDQLPAALALEPDLVSLNGGGNDIMRPGADPAELVALLERAIGLCSDSGVRLIILSGADPSAHLPVGRVIHRRGNELAAAVTRLCSAHGVTYVDNWSDEELRRSVYWSVDRLHLNSAGHRRVAGRLLGVLGLPDRAGWLEPAATTDVRRSLRENTQYYRDFVVPWVQRRLTGRSSGDGRIPKVAQWRRLSPEPPTAGTSD